MQICLLRIVLGRCRLVSSGLPVGFKQIFNLLGPVKQFIFAILVAQDRRRLVRTSGQPLTCLFHADLHCSACEGQVPESDEEFEDLLEPVE